MMYPFSNYTEDETIDYLLFGGAGRFYLVGFSPEGEIVSWLEMRKNHVPTGLGRGGG